MGQSRPKRQKARVLCYIIGQIGRENQEKTTALEKEKNLVSSIRGKMSRNLVQIGLV